MATIEHTCDSHDIFGDHGASCSKCIGDGCPFYESDKMTEKGDSNHES